MNDPNGLVYYKGLWHLFYQHQPVQLHHGPMHWGHAVSSDLTRWEHWPIAINPDYLGTIWSGSVAVHVRDDGTEGLVAFYTQSETERGQIQSIAFSQDEGKTWQPCDKNPVLDSERPDFRDPKVFRHGDQWIMAISGGHEAHFYGSFNLTDWTLLSTFPTPQERWIWECPDLLQVDGRWILIVSFIVPGGEVAAGSRTQYWIGEFDGTRFTPQSEMHTLSFGPDDYAAVSWSDTPDNRKIIIGWMSHWNYANHTPSHEENWRGAMTLPRELSVKKGTLRQLPPHELSSLRGEAISFQDGNIAFEGEAYEIEAEIDMTNLSQGEVGFHLRISKDEVTKVLYRPAQSETSQGELSIDRTRSGQSDFHPQFAGDFRGPLKVENGILKLRIFVDRSSVEVFAQDGILYGAALIFPSAESHSIEFVGEGAQLNLAIFYPYSSIN